ncbi:MAG: deoxyguanosinetriphosphate triphosphohydrolase [Pirellulales bacterium]|nr:deoxyguanosinetriphosphate triphosphohydrolase [Pirellulales bacterium]
MPPPDLTTLRESALLASYAMHSADSLGRRHPEPLHPYRGPYQRDRDRILHCAAFRRLSHKTQVFTGEMGDYHRTRLTHTLEVASIARTIARALRINEDLVEALAFAHDLGHPPFGHSGEDTLNDCLQNHGGFNHNAQALRVCELLESSYRPHPGLNLSHEVLEGQAYRARKHLKNRASRDPLTPPPPPACPLLEVQVVDAADSIAYNAHDADDSLELGLLTVEQLLEVPFWRDARDRVVQRHPSLSHRQVLRAVVHELIDCQVTDLVANASHLLSDHRIRTVGDVHQAPPLVTSSPELSDKKSVLEHFLLQNVYRHPTLLAKRRPAQHRLMELFDRFLKEPSLLPVKFQQLAETEGLPRTVADYLAGMTDRFAFDEHRRLSQA